MSTIWTYVCNRCKRTWKVATSGNSPPGEGSPAGKGPKCPSCGFSGNSPRH